MSEDTSSYPRIHPHPLLFEDTLRKLDKAANNQLGVDGNKLIGIFWIIIMIIRFMALKWEFGNWANLLKEQTFVWLNYWQKTLDFKLKTKITGVLRKNVLFYKNLNQKMDVLYMPSVLSWQLLRYMIIYWIYEQTVSENVECRPTKPAKAWDLFCRETSEAVTITKA